MSIKNKPNRKYDNSNREEVANQIRLDDLNARQRQVALCDGQHKKNVLDKLLLGIPITQACKECGIEQSTLRGWIFHDPVFTEAYKKCRLGEKFMLIIKAREALHNILDDERTDMNGKDVVAASTKLATAKLILEKMDGDFKEKTEDPIVASPDNPEEAFLIIETVSDSKAWHDGTGKGNMVVIVESDGEDVRSGVRGKSDESDFLEDD